MPSTSLTRLMAAASTLAAILLLPVHAGADEPEVRATSLFLYQGQLARNGVLVSGPVDLQFSLWSSRTGGVQLGRTITVRNLNVIDGWVSRQLNFGPGNDPNGNTPFFTGAQRFVQISVRAPAGTGTFVPLNPRQEIRPTPYSLMAFSALRALSVDWGNVENSPVSTGAAGTGGASIPSGNLGIGTTTALVKLDVESLELGTNNPAGLFSVSNCGDVCAQEDFQETIRLQNTNGNGQNGIGFLVSESRGINQAPDVWVGTGYAGGGAQNDFIISTRTGPTTLTQRLYLDGETGHLGLAAIPNAGAVLNVGGNVRCVAVIETSAREVKTAIEPLTGALENVLKLRGVRYAWNDQAPESVRGQKDLGFIADEVQAVFPDMVAKDAAGKPIGIKYTKFAPVAVEAIKQLKAENNELRARLERLEALVERQTAAGGVR